MFFRGSLTAASFSDIFSLPKAKPEAKELKKYKKIKNGAEKLHELSLQYKKKGKGDITK